MSMTPYNVNDYNFSEVTINDKHPIVTNNLGRTAKAKELVYLGGYFGEVDDVAGIANGASGCINIDAERIIRTAQIETTDTFTIGNTLWFVSGGSGAAGKLVDADPGTGTRYACGIITGEGGSAGAQTYVEFRPFVQRLDAADVSAQISVLQSEMAVEQAEPKTKIFNVTADASGAGLAITGLSEGDEIVFVTVQCRATSANGTLKITDGTSDITNAIACATDKNIVAVGTIDDAKSVLPTAGAKVVAAGDTAGTVRGQLVITYIPAAV